jgi:hypothetical protein
LKSGHYGGRNLTAAPLDQLTHGGGLMHAQVVEQHDIAMPQAGRQALPHPGGEGRRIHRLPLGGEGDHALPPYRAQCVKLSPRFSGRGSTNSSLRHTHACERPMARLAPASSMKTKRSGATPCIAFRNAMRFAATSGRSISLGRGRFFKHEAGPPQRPSKACLIGPLRRWNSARV